MGSLIGILILFSVSAQAMDIVFYIADINNRLPIEGAFINVYGNMSNYLNSTYSSSLGYGNLTINESLEYYTVEYSKIGYHAQSVNYTWTIDSAESVYMYPISEDGIVRIKFNDLTYKDREFCVFYDLNDRLEGCYSQNETVQLLVNQAYTVTPKLETLDLLSSEKSIKDNFLLYAMLIGAVMVAAFPIGLILYLLYSMMKGKR